MLSLCLGRAMAKKIRPVVLKCQERDGRGLDAGEIYMLLGPRASRTLAASADGEKGFWRNATSA